MIDRNYKAMEESGKGILCEYKIPKCPDGKTLLIVAHRDAIVFFEVNEEGEPYKCITGVNNEFDPYKLGGEDKVETAVVELAETIYGYIQQKVAKNDWWTQREYRDACQLAYTNSLFHMVCCCK